MILDITYLDKAPEQIQGVRTYTVYTQSFIVGPEIVIHFKEYKTQRNIKLADILTIVTTND